MASCTINFEKLYQDLDGKRRHARIGWKRLAERLGVSRSTLRNLNPKIETHPERRRPGEAFRFRQTMDGNLLVTLLDYLQKPISDYTIKNPVEVYEIANGNQRSQRPRRASEADRLAS